MDFQCRSHATALLPYEEYTGYALGFALLEVLAQDNVDKSSTADTFTPHLIVFLRDPSSPSLYSLILPSIL